ncbi:7TM diverse intracellular signaling domain-containing protein [Corticimicrobacter populi]|uniref:histidine kinase n=1 Tax=Corticimicrobacter populi TaxID=2175229 RepID=A0A2V1K1M3_9BURK|nr:7TM diverse intracellular signaling domain-containing protein [Corticimicrobacter populi]PWF24006.1 histidine kinase [Corticimicrobacter populi]
MPHQAHLSQAGRLVAHPRRERGSPARFAALILLWLGLFLPVLVQAACQPQITQVRMAPERAGDGQRPTEGWQTVTLPDIWQRHWPGFNGPVWYRVDWQTACPAQTVALHVSGMAMAGQVFLNDALLWQDDSLAEPMSRSWNVPRQWLLPAAALDDTNTLWFRIVAPAHLSPGLGSVMLGTQAQIDARHQGRTRQRDLYAFNLVVSLVLAGLFLVFWLVRRSEHAFGWFALASLLWSATLSNVLVTTPWPFDNSTTWARWNIVALIAYCCAFCMFTWSFGNIRMPRLAMALWSLSGIVALALLLMPATDLYDASAVVALVYACFFCANCLQFIFHAWRSREPSQLLFAACLALFVLIAVHDVLAHHGLIDVPSNHGPISAPLISICLFLILAWRYAGNLRRIEAFNEELQTAVQQTRTELTQTLQREHQLEADNIRLNERLRMTHDLHDSLGSSLMRSMAVVNQSRQLGGEQFLSILRELRTDLRHVIDGSSDSMTLEQGTPTEWIAPLRRRFTSLFDDLGLASRWTLPPEWSVHLSPAQLLGLTRFLEEALTNVLKHSQASHLSVSMQGEPDGQTLLLSVEDDGRGFDVEQARHAGIGMQSMHRRIERINGTLLVTSTPGITRLSARIRPDKSPATQAG